jgi:hypothetical protein
MSTSERPTDGAAPPGESSRALFLLTTFVAAIFLSAALLFAVQPMFTKMVVPRLGGAAAVWSVAMVFFQATLLAGYAYAHLLTRVVPGRMSVIIHLAVMIIACLALPLHIAAGWGRPPQQGEALWLLGLFTVSIGLPFFALAANAPLLQAWFARTDHPSARDPYFLYAASNAGSFLALLSYPLAIEPLIRLSAQTWYWSVGFYGLIALIAGCGYLMLRWVGVSPVVATAPGTMEDVRPTWRDALKWIALAAVPSGLLIAVTAHIATDVASVPLLWVVPLALYLLTFVIVFQTRPVIPHRLVVQVQPFFVLALVVVVVVGPFESTPVLIAIHLVVFFVCVLMCHGELARRRPPPRYLTGYYMWISVGGMVGGILTGLVAPHVFTRVLEYPLLVVLAMLCRPGLALPRRGTGEYLLFAGLIALAALLAVMQRRGANFDNALFYVLVGLLVGITALFWRSPLPLAAIVAFLLIGSHYLPQSYSIYMVRNFYGVLNVTATPDGRFHGLWHGTTGQGSQRIRDDEGNLITGRPEMIAEFHKGAGIAQLFDALRARIGGPINFAVVGLGTGTLACQVQQPGDKGTYYELDPDVARIARNPKLFTYISECAPDIEIKLGDARLTLADAPDGTYDLVFVDAFLGAAIPIHLLTREAMELYFKKLKPSGVLGMHISNRNLELATVVVNVAHSHGLIARVYDGGDVDEDVEQLHWIPKVAVIGRRDQDFGVLANSEFWPQRGADRRQRVWTDDYSNIVGAVIRNLRERGELPYID